jgi:hypothetical protein
MTLKKATLIALIGQIIAVVPTVISHVFLIKTFTGGLSFISLICYLTGTGTLILFLYTLYKKQ